MTIERTKLEARRLTARTLKKIRLGMERDGAVAFENLFPPSLLRRMRREVLRRHESGELRERGLIRDIGGRYAAVLPFEGPFLEPEFYANPRLLAIVEAFLGARAASGAWRR